jgi:hypothetical protein
MPDKKFGTAMSGLAQTFVPDHSNGHYQQANAKLLQAQSLQTN